MTEKSKVIVFSVLFAIYFIPIKSTLSGSYVTFLYLILVKFSRNHR
jgi:hypothetical protein